MQQIQRHNARQETRLLAVRPGVAIADCGGRIRTLNQLGGSGWVFNKALTIPGHIGGSWRSLENVLIPPGASVGLHQQQTDEIYFCIRGTAILTTNAVPEEISSGTLALAPQGTMHTIENRTNEPFEMLVVELAVPAQADALVMPPSVIAKLNRSLTSSSWYFSSQSSVASDATQSSVMQADSYLLENPDPFDTSLVPWHVSSVPLRVVSIDLSPFFQAPWGDLSLVEVPAGGRIFSYRTQEKDENLFILSGHATIIVAEECFDTEEWGLNVLVPRGVARSIINRSIAEPMQFLSLTVQHSHFGGTTR